MQEKTPAFPTSFSVTSLFPLIQAAFTFTHNNNKQFPGCNKWSAPANPGHSLPNIK
jgi:hypothetical protein